jgi:hypothetical protein
MRRALGMLVLSFGIVGISPHADARGGGGGFGVGFSGGFRGLAGQPPAFRPFTGFRRQFAAHRAFFPVHRFRAFAFGGRTFAFGGRTFAFGGRRGFGQVPVWSGGWPWWFGDNGGGTYLPSPEPPQPEVIVIQPPDQGPRVAEPAPDYSYAGCHAVPNGYYCDVHKRAG